MLKFINLVFAEDKFKWFGQDRLCDFQRYAGLIAKASRGGVGCVSIKGGIFHK